MSPGSEIFKKSMSLALCPLLLNKTRQDKPIQSNPIQSNPIQNTNQTKPNHPKPQQNPLQTPPTPPSTPALALALPSPPQSTPDPLSIMAETATSAPPSHPLLNPPPSNALSRHVHHHHNNTTTTAITRANPQGDPAAMVPVGQRPPRRPRPPEAHARGSPCRRRQPAGEDRGAGAAERGGEVGEWKGG